MKKVYYTGILLFITVFISSFGTGEREIIYFNNNILQELPQKGNKYEQLNAYLEKYKRIAEIGGWNTIEKGEILEAGMQNDKVALIKKRLKISGDYINVTSTDVNMFDDNLKHAVMFFQERHGLDTTGKVDKKTIDVLNIPVEEKIKIIKINLKRISKIPEDLGDYYIFINIVKFELEVVKNDTLIAKHKVIVGKPNKKTPLFNATMEFLVFNPNWTIPPGILKNDIMPLVKKDLKYLTRNNIYVYDKNYNRILCDTINWESNSIYFYKYIQEPGENNAFGDVKFVLPNPYNLYMHDTQHKRLFWKKERALSSGCIRVDKPLELAGLLLEDTPKWNMNRIREFTQTNIRKRVDLYTKPKVYIVYWTSWVDYEGILHFRKDIYSKD